MKIDLEELERKARAAVGGRWEVRDGARITCDNRDDIADASKMGWSDEQCRSNANHIAANIPQITLALISRIRELELALNGAASIIEGATAAHSQHEDFHEDLDWKSAQTVRRIADGSSL